jgi:hypothetical protein
MGVSMEPIIDVMDDSWETPCPSPKSDGWHCEHWYDGEECHWCGDKALTDAELEEMNGRDLEAA